MKIADILLTSPVLWKSNVLEPQPAGVITGQVTAVPAETSAIGGLYTALALATTMASVYHGYKRNDSIGWALGWGLFGSALPVVAIPVMLAQGFGDRKGK